MTARRPRPPYKRSTPLRVWVLVLVLALAAGSAVMTVQAFSRFQPFRSAPRPAPALAASVPLADAGFAEVGGDRAIAGDLAAGIPQDPVAPHGSVLRPATPAELGPEFTVPVLLYHYVRDNPEHKGAPGWELSVSPEEFARQMAYARSAGVHTVTLADVIAAMRGGPPLPARSVVLTFDDGYADFATTAAPILEREHLIGTDYVVSGFMGRPNYMTPAQVRDVAAHGMVIGAHTVHHVSLAKISPDLAGPEITDSKAALQQLLGHPVDDFAYPYGDYNASVVTQVVNAGFRDAVTTDAGTGQHLPLRFQLRRTRVGAADTVASFARKALLPVPPPEAETAAVTLPASVPTPATAPAPPPSPAQPPPTPLPPEPSTLIVPIPSRASSPSPHPGTP